MKGMRKLQKNNLFCFGLDVDSRTNIISSHELYKVKVDENKLFKWEARIAPHEDKDSLKRELRSGCLMCAPVGVQILVPIAAVQKWRLSRVDVRSAFL